MLEDGLGRASLDGWFEVVYVEEDGAEQRLPWQQMPQVVDGLSRPVRSFPSYRGQRNFPGWYWSATLGHRIGFESWVERDHLIALDFDPSVVAMVSQLLWLHWTERLDAKASLQAREAPHRVLGGTHPDFGHQHALPRNPPLQVRHDDQ